MAEETTIRSPGQPTKYNDTMPERVDLFIEKSKQNDRLPTHAGLAKYLGICKTTVQNWAKSYPEFLFSLEQLNDSQEDELINQGLKSIYNPTICKLILSSNHGYCERTDTTSDGEKIEPQIVSFLDIVEAAKTATQVTPEDKPEGGPPDGG